MNCKQSNTIIALLLLFSAVVPAMAQRPFNQWQPDDGFAIRQGWHIEWYRGGEARDEGQLAGEVAFVWSDTRIGDRGVSMQVVDVDGELKYGENGLRIADSTGRQEDPGVWPDLDGGWFVAWEDFDIWFIEQGDSIVVEGDSLGDIYCTKIDANGNRIWGNNERCVPVCVFPGIQEDVRIVHDGQGGCIIAWRDMRGGDTGDIYAMHILADGRPDPEWPENGLAVVVEEGPQTSHTADSDGVGGMIIGWKDGRIVGDNNIWAHRITPDGDLPWGNGEGIPICDQGSNQEAPKLCIDGAGGAFFTWVDDRNLDQINDKDIYAQRVDRNGRLMWSRSDEGVPLVTEVEEQLGNRIVYTGAGNAIVVWEDKRENGEEPDIYSMRITGVDRMQKQWQPEQGVQVCVAPRNQQYVRLYPDAEGGAYYVWEDERDGGAPEIDIWAQRLRAENGAPAWQDNGIPICRVGGTQNAPIVRRTADGGAVFAWADYRDGSAAIYAQRLTEDGRAAWDENGIKIVSGIGGNALWPKVLPKGDNTFNLFWLDGRFSLHGAYPFVQYCVNRGDHVDTLLDAGGVPVITDVFGNCVSPDAINDGRDGMIVVWEDHRRGQRYSIYAQRMDPDGEKDWGNGGIPIADFPYDQNSPRICSDGEGGAIVAWKALTGDLILDIYMQRIDREGQRLWGEEGIRLTTGLYDEFVEDIVPDGAGGAVVVWLAATGRRRTDDDLWAARINAEGEVVWGDGAGVVVCNEQLKQRYSRLVRHQSGFVVTWTDGRDDEGGQPQNDIYAQLIYPNGNMVWPLNGYLVCGFEHHQENPDVAVDNAGSTWIVWEDYRFTGTPRKRDIYIQKIDPTLNERGRPRDVFERDGMPVCAAVRDQTEPMIIHDGQNGMWVVWEDYRIIGVWSDIYVNHLRENGVPYPEWEPNGNVVCAAFHKQNYPHMGLLTPRGDDGVVIVWDDKRATGKEELSDTYIMRVDDNFLAVNQHNRPYHPSGYALEHIYPNPFNSQTLITFVAPQDGTVKIVLFDATGRLVDQLSNDYWSAGRHLIVLDGENYAAGSYFVRLEARDVKLERTINLVK